MAVDSGFKQLAGGLENLGSGIRAIITKEDAAFFIVMVILSILFATLYKALLKKIPLFEGSGDTPVNSSGNVVAWCLSLLSVFAIGWYTKDQGTKAVIDGIAGPFGVWVIVLMLGFLGWGVYSNLESFPTRWRFGYTIFTCILVYLVLIKGFFNGDWGLFFILIFGWIVYLIISSMIRRGRIS
jgi:hypothetical protein